MTVKFVWSELCALCYECCLTTAQSSNLPLIFTKLIDFSIQNELNERMGELLRALLPIFCLHAEGKRMDEKPIRSSQKVLLRIFTSYQTAALTNPRFALIQRLIINTPDRVDDRANTIDCLLQLLLPLTEAEKQRVNRWISACSRCGIANIRMCAVCLSRALLMSRYVADSIEAQSKEKASEKVAAEAASEKVEDTEEKINETGENTEESMDGMEVERTVLECELFFDEKPLYWMFFEIILNRCNDIVISIRSEAIHVSDVSAISCVVVGIALRLSQSKSRFFASKCSR